MTTPEPPRDEPVKPLSGAVRRGLSWMAASTIIGRALSFVVLFVLGRLLVPEDFAVYGAALAVSALLGVFRNGGVIDVLIQRGPTEWARLVPTGFWLAFAINTAVAVLLGAAAALNVAGKSFGETYADPRLPWLLVIMAAAIPVQTIPQVLNARLSMDLRFGGATAVSVLSQILRYATTIAMLYAGLGPYSLAWPMLLCAVAEAAAFWILTRESPWAHPPSKAIARSLIGRSAWSAVAGLGNYFVDKGNYLVIPAFAAQAVVGVYYFGFEITMQLAALMSWNLQLVLMPALARIKDDPDRLRAAMMRSLRALMVLACPMCLGLAACIEPLESLLWRGKWSAGVDVIIALAVIFPARITFGYSNAVLMGQGRFKHLSIAMIIEGTFLVVGGAAGAIVTGSALGIAVTVGLAMLVSRTAITLYTLATNGVSAAQYARALGPAWLISIFSAAAAMASSLAITQTALGPRLIDLTWSAGPRWALAALSVAQLAQIAIVFTVIYALLTRAINRRQLDDALHVLPARLRAPAARLMRVEEPS